MKKMHRQLVTLMDMTDEEYEELMDAPGLSAYYPYSLSTHSVSGMQGLRIAVANNFPVPTVATENQTHEPTPWRNTTCALCTSEIDCRLKDEYCGSDGCCHKGECVLNEDCAQQDALRAYYHIEGFDSLGSNINPMNPQNDLSLVQKLCDVNPDCVGYNSYGLLKYGISQPSLWTPQPSTAALPELTPWALYIKKSATQGKNPKVKLPASVKQYCTQAPTGHPFAVMTGMCRQCVGCGSDSDCPDSTVCNMQIGCCVNNPCYVATPEEGKWVDGRYARDNQCECGAGEPYCCLRNAADIHSAFCSKQPCELQDKVRACSYICEDPQRKHDAVMCKATQRCCNSKDGAPVCCSGDCDSGATNKCIQSTGLVECKAAPGTPFESTYCKPTQKCCNSAKAPPVCCNRPDLGCAASATTNGCNYSELATETTRYI